MKMFLPMTSDKCSHRALLFKETEVCRQYAWLVLLQICFSPQEVSHTLEASEKLSVI
jgi:hypothetical protein